MSDSATLGGFMDRFKGIAADRFCMEVWRLFADYPMDLLRMVAREPSTNP
jgi:sarcosine oxidase gamma subunit